MCLSIDCSQAGDRDSPKTTLKCLMSGGPCNLNKGEVYLGQLPNNRFEVILFETSHPILTSSLLRKRWKQSIRECLYLENAVT